MILVTGGGFGLYGHVAALAGIGAPVAAPVRYRTVAEARAELAPLVNAVRWVDDEIAAARAASATVLARDPAANAALARRLVYEGIGGRLVIEKPLGTDPDRAAALEAALVAAGRRWAVPYMLLDCDWSDALRDALARGASATIDWSHRPSPHARGWKSDAARGGGAIAFYFIHALALVEAMLPGAVTDFSQTRDGHTECLALTASNGHGTLAIRFALGPAPTFALTIGEAPAFVSASPFGALPEAGRPDPRVPMLMRFHRRAAAGDCQPPAFHAAVTRRWARIAGQTREAA